MHQPEQKVSIIINNYNYGHFLKQAIDSVLEQTVPAHEVIVVDDGSTDDSLSILKEYGKQIIAIPKTNGGQASAFNAGFQVSTGDWIWFLDADDWLEKQAIEKVSHYTRKGVAKLHGLLYAVDEQGKLLDYCVPPNRLSNGEVIKEMEENGGYSWPPTTGNVFPRWALEQCMPMPEEEYRLCADLYICNYTAVLGPVLALPEPLGFYRIHAKNRFHGFRLDPVWLKNQASNILIAARLTQGLVRKFSANNNFQYPYGRRNVEMLMIADRFSHLKPVGRLSKKELNKCWWSSSDIQKSSGKTRYKAVVFWFILSYAPKPLARYVIRRGLRKGAKALLKNKLGI